MLGTFVLAAVFVGQVCADCSLARDNVRLCTAHAEEERATFNEVRKRLASKLEADRIAALDRLSSLTASHVNAPSEKVARCLAESLADESFEVREHAARLLGPPQHAIRAMEALLAALSTADKELTHLLDEEQELFRKKNSVHSEKEAKDIAVDLKSNERRQEMLVSWRRTLAGQLGRFPDDRVVTRLWSLARPLVEAPEKALKERGDVFDRWDAQKKAWERLPNAIDLDGALVRLGSREARRAVIESLGVLKAEIEELQGAVRDSSGSGLRGMLESMLRSLDEARDRTMKEIYEILADKPLTDPLPESRDLAEFLAWMEMNIASAPEHLPGIDSPAW